MMPNTMYRIYVEDIENTAADETPHALVRVVSTYFDAFTLLKGAGFWKGVAERTAIIEILTDDGAKVQTLAEELRHLMDQEAVLVTRTAVVATLVVEPVEQVEGLRPIGEEV